MKAEVEAEVQTQIHIHIHVHVKVTQSLTRLFDTIHQVLTYWMGGGDDGE